MLFGQFVLHRSIGGDIFRADYPKDPAALKRPLATK
jgi:hypothetical protein